MSSSPEDLKQEIEDLKTSHATQAAMQAGQASTMAATQAGTWSTMAAGAVALIVGMFLGLAVANSK
jgi:hypothetical protein